MFVHQCQRLLRVQMDEAVAAVPVTGQGGKFHGVAAHFDGLRPEPGHVAQGHGGVHILLEDLYKIPHLPQVGHRQHLGGHGFQKGLLGLHPADVLRAVASAVVVVAETDHLHGLLAAQMLHPLGEVDVKVLEGIVVIHVDRDLKIHTADGVHQGLKPREIHGHGKVHRDAKLFGDGVRQQVRAAGVIGEVDLVLFAVDDGLGVPGDAGAVDGTVLAVKTDEDVGVAAAVAVILAGEEDGVEIGLALLVSGLGGGLCVLKLGVGQRLLLRCICLRQVRGLEKTVNAGIEGGGHNGYQQ